MRQWKFVANPIKIIISPLPRKLKYCGNKNSILFFLKNNPNVRSGLNFYDKKKKKEPPNTRVIRAKPMRYSSKKYVDEQLVKYMLCSIFGNDIYYVAAHVTTP